MHDTGGFCCDLRKRNREIVSPTRLSCRSPCGMLRFWHLGWSLLSAATAGQCCKRCDAIFDKDRPGGFSSDLFPADRRTQDASTSGIRRLIYRYWNWLSVKHSTASSYRGLVPLQIMTVVEFLLRVGSSFVRKWNVGLLWHFMQTRKRRLTTAATVVTLFHCLLAGMAGLLMGC
jgi:hypothetical protein